MRYKPILKIFSRTWPLAIPSHYFREEETKTDTKSCDLPRVTWFILTPFFCQPKPMPFPLPPGPEAAHRAGPPIPFSFHARLSFLPGLACVPCPAPPTDALPPRPVPLPCGPAPLPRFLTSFRRRLLKLVVKEDMEAKTVCFRAKDCLLAGKRMTRPTPLKFRFPGFPGQRF